MGLAPTTSTTMTLALGDALAVALLERRGFTADDFQMLHPGGQLGRRLLKVADIMHNGDDVPCAAPDAAMAEALIAMSARSASAASAWSRARPAGRRDHRRRPAPAHGDRTCWRGGARRHDRGAGHDRPEAARGRSARHDERPSARSPPCSSWTAGGIIGILHIHDILHAGVA